MRSDTTADGGLRLSVVIPAFSDAARLRQLLSDLFSQDLEPEFYEVIVVDDGSPGPLEPQLQDLLECSRVATRCLRKPNGGGPSARNHGARVADGKILMFVDQDMRLPIRFLGAHLDAQAQVGYGAVSADYKNRMIDEGPFARWYASICKNWEHNAHEAGREVAPGVFCVPPTLLTSTNLSLPRVLFEEAGGFPVYKKTGVEDQAFGLTLGRRGVGVFRINSVSALHVETRTQLERFCERQRVGMAATVQLIRQFPDVFGGLRESEHYRVNGPLRLQQDPFPLVIRKLAKALIMLPPALKTMYLLSDVLERVAPSSSALMRIYHSLLAAHLQRGWREGLRDFAVDFGLGSSLQKVVDGC